VGFLPLYNFQGPSSRYRIYQFLEPLSRLGFACTYLEAPEKNLWKRLRYLPKLFSLAANNHLLYVQKRTFPDWVQNNLQRINPNLVFDIDDAIYLEPKRKPAVDKIMQAAKIIVAGNKYLADYATQFGSNVVIVPSVIDTSVYAPPKGIRHPGEKEVVIGWTGTDPNRGDLRPMKPLFDWLGENFPDETVLRTIGRRPLEMETKLRVDFVPWTIDSGRRALQDFDIGIMPLEDTEWNRGKCGFKLIQYMAVGIPAVATPIGVNQEIILDGQTGYLASSVDEWKEMISRLIERKDLRRRMGVLGRKRVISHYSVHSALPKLESVLRQAASTSGS
jgi:glycosyltransferase involved in cell wall biosynthesis